MTSLIEIKRGDLYSDTMTFRELPESGLILRRFSIVDEKTNLFATLSDLPTDLDLYIGKINPATNEPYPTPILTAILPYKVYNSSTNPGNESEKIFAQLEPGEYWIGIKDNINLTTEEKNKPFKLSLDAQTFDKTTRLSNDPELVRQWHLFNTGLPQLDEWFTAPNVDIGAPEAWKLGFDAEIPIAIIDGGIDINHPDLINNLWTNPKEIAGNNLDDDNNGYKDDLHGWNFADGTANVMPDRHGTHVAGITGAKGNNGIGVSGVAWNTQLMTLDVFGNADRASLQAQIDAIKYAVNNGAKVINMSLGGHFKITPEEYLNNSNNEKFAEVLKYAYDKDVFIAIAAGNAGNQLHDRNMWEGVGNLDKYSGSPALFSRIFGNIASVGSSNGQNDRAEYSNFGKSISISAPGGDNQSIQIQSEEDTRIYEGRIEAEIFSTLPDASYGYMAGTSMASPVIAGMAALIRAQNESINARDTVAILRAGAVINSQLNSSVNQNYQANLYNSMILAQNWIGPDSLTGIGQEVAPVINLTALTDAQSLTGSLKLERDSSNDPVIGFYRVLDTSGTVLDALGNAVKPGDADYQSVALSPSNLSDGLNTLTLENNSSRSVNYSLDGLVNGFYLAPYAITANNTWFAWSQANSDRQDHFKVLGSNQFGLDDQAGPGRDGNFSDVIMSFFSSEII
tara:strand:+ start:513 stop:2555 length:2043 start_codon:yes stop_codon:yes gene_type:complete